MKKTRYLALSLALIAAQAYAQNTDAHLKECTKVVNVVTPIIKNRMDGVPMEKAAKTLEMIAETYGRKTLNYAVTEWAILDAYAMSDVNTEIEKMEAVNRYGIKHFTTCMDALRNQK
jgi:GTP-binding protein EngB required for normal cell division